MIIELEIHGCERLRLTITHPLAGRMLGGATSRAEGAAVAAPGSRQARTHRQATAPRRAVIIKIYARTRRRGP
jgi:hypothetical protein